MESAICMQRQEKWMDTATSFAAMQARFVKNFTSRRNDLGITRVWRDERRALFVF
jgi:hypothetical protein